MKEIIKLKHLIKLYLTNLNESHYSCFWVGKRLKKFTKKKPKCLIEINGKKIIEYLYPFIKYFKKIYLVAGFKADLVKKFLRI